MFPTTNIFESSIPSLKRIFFCVSVGAKQKSEILSVRTRFVSSGMFVYARRPASTCAIGMWSFVAARETARTVLVSPWTISKSGFSSKKIFSTSISIRPVMFPWVPDPMPRLYFASGRFSSCKKMASIFLS